MAKSVADQAAAGAETVTAGDDPQSADRPEAALERSPGGETPTRRSPRYSRLPSSRFREKVAQARRRDRQLEDERVRATLTQALARQTPPDGNRLAGVVPPARRRPEEPPRSGRATAGTGAGPSALAAAFLDAKKKQLGEDSFAAWRQQWGAGTPAPTFPIGGEQQPRPARGVAARQRLLTQAYRRELRENATRRENRSLNEALAEKLMRQLEQGSAPWQKRWTAADLALAIPMNPARGERYHGVGVLQLMSEARKDPRWLTQEEVARAGAQIRPGETGVAIREWQFTATRVKKNRHGQPRLDAQGQPVREERVLKPPRAMTTVVYNAEQIDGLPPLQPRPVEAGQGAARAEEILRKSGVAMRKDMQGRTFYRHETDTLHLPNTVDADGYYAAALHELGRRATGRRVAHPRGSDAQAGEDMALALASLFVGNELGIANHPVVALWPAPDAAAAPEGDAGARPPHPWLKVLKEKPALVMAVAAQAEKIHQVLTTDDVRERSLEAASASAAAPREAARPRSPSAQQLGVDLGWEPLTTKEQARIARSERSRPAGQRRARQAGAKRQKPLHERIAAKLVAQLEQGTAPWQRPWGGAELSAALPENPLTGQRYHGINLLQLISEARKDPRWLTHEQASAVGASVRTGEKGTPIVCWEFTETRDKTERGALVLDAQGRPVKEEVQLERPKKSLAVVFNGEQIDGLPALQARAKPENGLERAQRILGNADVSLRHIKKDMVFYTPKDRSIQLPEKSRFASAADYHAAVLHGLGQREASRLAGKVRHPFGSAAHAKEAMAVGIASLLTGHELGTGHDPRQQAAYAASWIKILKTDPREILSAAADAEKIHAALLASEKRTDKQSATPAGRARVDGPEQVGRARPSAALAPRDEFAAHLLAIGCVVDGEHPILDGKRHRLRVEGDAAGETPSGVYIGRVDGQPMGRMKNRKSGEERLWVAKGYLLEDGAKQALLARAREQLEARTAAQAQRHAQAAQRVAQMLEKDLVPVRQPTPYMAARGIALQAGLYTDRLGQATFIPATDAEGRQWTMQRIDAAGRQGFAKDSRHDGCFHVVGGEAALARAPALIVCTSHAAASSVAQALDGMPTVAAFSSENLAAVSAALHAKYPDKPVLIAGADTLDAAMTRGRNHGRDAAEQAAQAVGGKAVLPIFARNEKAWPAAVPPVTPETFAKGEVSSAQREALARLKAFSDFNDLATRSRLSAERVGSQLRPVLDKMIARQQVWQETAQQKRVPQRQHKPRRLVA